MSSYVVTQAPHSEHVAPCIHCGSVDISLIHGARKATEKMGGGRCEDCNTSAIDHLPGVATLSNMAAVWNARNDVKTLLAAEEQKIAVAQARIKELRAKLGPELRALDEDDIAECLMTAEEFIADEKRGMLSCDDGVGYWGTATHRSDLTTYTDKPVWATHVVWYNK